MSGTVGSGDGNKDEDGKKNIDIDNKNHGIFTYMDEILKVRLSKVDFNDKNKDKLFRDFISIITDTLRKHLMVLANRGDINDMSIGCFNSLVMNTIFEYINETDDKLLIEFGINMIDNIKKSNWYLDFNPFILNYIQSIMQNRKDDDDNNFILYTIFAVISVSLKSIFEISTDRYRNMNGMLNEILKDKYGI